nr:cyclin-dependent protein kinase inhibitor SMR9 [Ipomoea batatas]
MGPSCRRRKPKRSRKSTAFKSSLPSKAAASEDSAKNGGDHEADGGGIGAADDVCSTPKAERFRIPAMETCPPAPKKRRVMTSWPPPSLRRSSNTPPIAFFAPPDIELFFYFALRGGVSV